MSPIDQRPLCFCDCKTDIQEDTAIFKFKFEKSATTTSSTKPDSLSPKFSMLFCPRSLMPSPR